MVAATKLVAKASRDGSVPLQQASPPPQPPPASSRIFYVGLDYMKYRSKAMKNYTWMSNDAWARALYPGFRTLVFS